MLRRPGRMSRMGRYCRKSALGVRLAIWGSKGNLDLPVGRNPDSLSAPNRNGILYDDHIIRTKIDFFDSIGQTLPVAALGEHVRSSPVSCRDRCSAANSEEVPLAEVDAPRRHSLVPICYTIYRLHSL